MDERTQEQRDLITTIAHLSFMYKDAEIGMSKDFVINLFFDRANWYKDIIKDFINHFIDKEADIKKLDWNIEELHATISLEDFEEDERTEVLQGLLDICINKGLREYHYL